jgi:predicted NUDIX family NTP pyrophosphohydrolase
MKKSAGLILYRKAAYDLEVLLVHPGGPFWAKKDFGAWSIPKGELIGGENPLVAAKREFEEELGIPPPEINWQVLDTVRYSGKELIVWAGASNMDIGHVESNTFEMIWPPKSKTIMKFPEIDRAEWFPLESAKKKIIEGQKVLLDRIFDVVNRSI